MTNRRDFLKTGVVATASLSVLAAATPSWVRRGIPGLVIPDEPGVYLISGPHPKRNACVLEAIRSQIRRRPVLDWSPGPIKPERAAEIQESRLQLIRNPRKGVDLFLDQFFAVGDRRSSSSSMRLLSVSAHLKDWRVFLTATTLARTTGFGGVVKPTAAPYVAVMAWHLDGDELVTKKNVVCGEFPRYDISHIPYDEA